MRDTVLWARKRTVDLYLYSMDADKADMAALRSMSFKPGNLTPVSKIPHYDVCRVAVLVRRTRFVSHAPLRVGR